MALKNKLKTRFKNITKDLDLSALAFLSDPALLKELQKITEAPANIYDKAMDSEFLYKLSGGGGNHRLFDNGHSLFDAWEKVKKAHPDDSFFEEVSGYASSIWRDVTTPKGLPFTSLEKESYEAWAEAINDLNIPGLDKNYIYDFCSFDALEVLGTALGVVGAALALKKEDHEKLSEILGSMGIVSIISANPLMGLCTVVTTAYAYKKNKKIKTKNLIQGSLASGISALTLSVLGLPFLIELVIAVVVVRLVKSDVWTSKDFYKNIKRHSNRASKDKIIQIFEELKLKKVS